MFNVVCCLFVVYGGRIKQYSDMVIINLFPHEANLKQTILNHIGQCFQNASGQQLGKGLTLLTYNKSAADDFENLHNIF